MSVLKSLILLLLVGYLAVLAAMYWWQRSLMYFPERIRTPPAAAGLPPVAEVELTTADGETILAWYKAAEADEPLILYFHGNGGSLRLRVDRFRKLLAHGAGLLAVSYRGYGGSTGTPTEAGLIEDARAAYDFAAALVPPERIIVFGESLGTAVAVALAAEKPIARLILDAPFTSAADIAAATYPFVPVRLLMQDQFRSTDRIKDVTAPVLVLHGELDRIIPIRSAERLYETIRGEKQFVRFPRGNHVDLDAHGAQEAIRAFIKP